MAWDDIQIHSPLSALVGYIESQRQQQRQQEDADMDRRIGLIHDLINSPGANPARTAEGIRGMLELSNAKADPNRKRAGGMAGFMGKHAEVMPDFLSNLIHGSAPFEGKTYSESTQTTQHPGFEHNANTPLDPSSMQQVNVPPQFDGKSVLSAPVTLPPPPMDVPPEASPMLSAARQMQTEQTVRTPLPPSQQPFKIDPAELAEQKQQFADQGTISHEAAMTQADIAEANRMAPIMGMTPGEFLKQKRGLLNPASHSMQSHKLGVLTTPDGREVFAIDTFNAATGRHELTDEYGLPIPPGSQPKQTAGSPYQQHMIQKPDGSYEMIYAPKDPTAAGAAGDVMTQPTGVVGRIPPPPQGNLIKVDGPNGPEYMRAQGNTVTPVKDAGGAAVQPAEPDRPMSAQAKQALTGLNFIESTLPDVLKSLGDPGQLSGNPIKRSAQLAMVERGWSPGGQVEDLLQTLGADEAYGIRGLLGGSRNMKMVDIIKMHLPQPGDSDKLTYEKITGLQKLVPKIKKAITDAESMTTRGARAGGSRLTPPPEAMKSVSAAMVRQYAAEHGIDEDAARQVFVDKHYVITR